MFNIEPLEKPIEIPVPSGLVRLTHSRKSLLIRPGEPEPLRITEQDGYMNGDRFEDYGDARVSTLDDAAYQVMLADTTGGKLAGQFHTRDIEAALTRKEEARVAAEEAAFASIQKNTTTKEGA